MAKRIKIAKDAFFPFVNDLYKTRGFEVKAGHVEITLTRKIRKLIKEAGWVQDVEKRYG